jgi:hypothetical protein
MTTTQPGNPTFQYCAGAAHCIRPMSWPFNTNLLIGGYFWTHRNACRYGNTFHEAIVDKDPTSDYKYMGEGIQINNYNGNQKYVEYYTGMIDCYGGKDYLYPDPFLETNCF